MSEEEANGLHKHPIAVYLILANGITWLCWIPGIVLAYRQGYILPNFNTYATLFQAGFANKQHILISVLFQLGVYGPLIAALVATGIDSGREGIIGLWGRIKKGRVGARWYLLILLIAFLLPGIPAGVAALTGVALFSTANGMGLSYLIVLFFAQILTSGIGEEPGWRGFLLPRLRTRFEGQKYIWLLGVIWALWHYPFTIFTTLSMMGDVTPVQMIVTILSSLAGQTMGIIGMTFLFVWVYNNTGSVFLAIVFHALINVIPSFVLSFLEDAQRLTMLIGFMPWVLVLALKVALGKERFSDQITAS